jgi:hypothetical protein
MLSPVAAAFAFFSGVFLSLTIAPFCIFPVYFSPFPTAIALAAKLTYFVSAAVFPD